MPLDLDDLIRRHSGLLHKVARAYCRDAGQREDLVQEMLLQLWRAGERFDGRCKESTWVYRVVLNVAISFWRRERRHEQVRAPGDAHALVATIAALPLPEPNADVLLLLECVRELAPLDRALALLWLDDRSHAEIGEVLGITAASAATRFHRLKDKLRQAMTRRRSRTGDSA